jgi:hypothetical protein
MKEKDEVKVRSTVISKKVISKMWVFLVKTQIFQVCGGNFSQNLKVLEGFKYLV